MSGRRLRIVSDDFLTQGTRVIDADTGEDIGLKITKVVLVGKVGDRWRCRLDVFIDGGLDIVAKEEP